jgi:hypothetical protein
VTERLSIPPEPGVSRHVARIALIVVPFALIALSGYRINFLPPPNPVGESTPWVQGATFDEMHQLMRNRAALQADWADLGAIGLLDDVEAPRDYARLTDAQRLAHLRAWRTGGASVFAVRKAAQRADAP